MFDSLIRLSQQLYFEFCFHRGRFSRKLEANRTENREETESRNEAETHRRTKEREFSQK